MANTPARSQPPFVSRNTELPSRGIRIHYLYAEPPADTPVKGTFLLIHGFPQTSYHYRHALPLLALAGYCAIAPDYRGAGKSSHPPSSDFRKTTLAADLHALLTTEPRLAHPRAFDARRARPDHFHLLFHAVPDLPEALIAGREEAYLRYFFDRQAYARDAVALAEYVADYALPAALRCGMGLHRALEADGEENREWLAREGRCRVPALGVSGARSMHVEDARGGMLEEMYEVVELCELEETGHYVAEESPEAFVEVMVEWAGRHP
ncbi:hypothetical protein SLS56_007936 [Neofusicoccum ribis]|uniref:AB hydrolase-1 domain-containing protein n=1 Tax=Neofusicoccum ribis TaxID=45134 RepID=A0ABR3SN83_9PEZI